MENCFPFFVRFVQQLTIRRSAWVKYVTRTWRRVCRFTRGYQRFGVEHPPRRGEARWLRCIFNCTQPSSPGIWHVVSQRSRPDSRSDSWRITVIACLWSLTSSWSHNYRMAFRSVNEHRDRCSAPHARLHMLQPVLSLSTRVSGKIRTAVPNDFSPPLLCSPVHCRRKNGR